MFVVVEDDIELLRHRNSVSEPLFILFGPVFLFGVLLDRKHERPLGPWGRGVARDCFAFCSGSGEGSLAVPWRAGWISVVFSWLVVSWVLWGVVLVSVGC